MYIVPTSGGSPYNLTRNPNQDRFPDWWRVTLDQEEPPSSFGEVFAKHPAERITKEQISKSELPREGLAAKGSLLDGEVCPLKISVKMVPSGIPPSRTNNSFAERSPGTAVADYKDLFCIGIAQKSKHVLFAG